MKPTKVQRLWDVIDALGDSIEYLGPFASYFELAKRIRESGTKTALFRNPFGKNEYVVSNLYSTRKKLALSINVAESDLLDHLARKFRAPTTNFVKQPIKDLIRSEGDKCIQPTAIKYYKDDYGAYITSAVVLAKDPESGYVNASIHRLLFLDNKRYVIRIVEGRHLHRIFQAYKSGGNDTPIAILIGSMPHIILAAASPLPWEVSELELASSLSGKPLHISDFPEIDFPVPTESEFIMFGEISRERMAPEMMVDILGTYDTLREQPVVHISAVYYKENPLTHAILPAGHEHILLMGLPRAARIKSELVEKGIDVKDLMLTSGSGGWLHCFISIRKKNPSDGKDAILISLNAHRSLKGVIVVDEDINVNDYESVDFAISTRFGKKEQLILMEGLRGSTLDPSVNHVGGITLKWGLDLTLDINAERRKFMKAQI